MLTTGIGKTFFFPIYNVILNFYSDEMECLGILEEVRPISDEERNAAIRNHLDSDGLKVLSQVSRLGYNH